MKQLDLAASMREIFIDTAGNKTDAGRDIN